MKNKKKKEVKIRDISKNKEITVMVWLLFAIGIVLWGGYEIKNTESVVAPATEAVLINKSEDEIFEKYGEEKKFLATIKENDENNEVLVSQLEDKEKGSKEYEELEREINNYNNNRIRYGLNGYFYFIYMRDTSKMIIIVVSIMLVVFLINFLLVLFKKYKIYNIISVIEVIIVFILEIIYGSMLDNITSLELNLNESVRFIIMLYPIMVGYVYYLFRKEV